MRRAGNADRPAVEADDNDEQEEPSPVPPTVIGWALRIASTLLIAGLLGYLLSKALSPQEEFRLAIETRWEERSTRDGQSLVPVEITNDSSVTVRNLQIELMADDPRPVEVAILLFGPGEKVTYVVPLERPRPLTHRVLSYER